MEEIRVKIQIEIEENEFIEGNEISWIEANKIANRNCKGLIYLKNVMDINSKQNSIYAWLKDDDSQEYYLIRL